MTGLKIQDDGFTQALLAKLPASIRDTFSVEQLQALKQALDDPKCKHAVDLRGQLRFWRWTFYFLFLFGRDRRGLTRRQIIAKRWALTIAISLFITISTLFGLLVLYLIKSAMGIDIFPHSSLGIWSWFKATFL